MAIRKHQTKQAVSLIGQGSRKYIHCAESSKIRSRNNTAVVYDLTLISLAGQDPNNRVNPPGQIFQRGPAKSWMGALILLKPGVYINTRQLITVKRRLSAWIASGGALLFPGVAMGTVSWPETYERGALNYTRCDVIRDAGERWRFFGQCVKKMGRAKETCILFRRLNLQNLKPFCF